MVLVVTNATTKFVSGVPLTYRFEIYNQAGNRIYQSPAVPQGSGGTTSVDVSGGADLEAEKPYQWQARAEYFGLPGPWSARASFIAPETAGYIRGSEVYDPLINGRTVGTVFGDVRFVPRGAHITWHDARIKYHIPTLTSGEFSMIVTNLKANTKGGKTKIMSMSQGDADMTTNARRFTIEKRGDPPGIIAWRVITSSDQIDTIGPERVAHNFLAERTYFWKARWGGGAFRLTIKDGGPNGVTIYEQGKPYSGVYNPNPHFAFVGSPPGRAGIESGSVNDMIVRQVWLSNRERPPFANK